MVSAPTLRRVLNLWSIPSNQLPNTLATLQGGYNTEAIWMTDHIEWANLHWKNKCFIVSSWWQKRYCELPCKFFLIRVSLVKMTPWRSYHAKILLLRGIFIFQIFLLLSTGILGWINALYIRELSIPMEVPSEYIRLMWQLHHGQSL